MPEIPDRLGGPERPADLIIVGGGPRAVSVLERLTARLAPGEEIGVVVIDAVEVGAGSTWRTDQRAEFLNNTYAGHTTIYADRSTPMAGPIRPGPDLATWARGVAAGTTTVPPGAAARPAWVRAEVSNMVPWSYPSRRLQGVYYREQLALIVARGGVAIREIRGVVVDLGVHGALRKVRLGDGSTLHGRFVILAQGMVQAAADQRTLQFQRAADAHKLIYIAPGMPSERDWDRVPAGENVLVAGLGANFFDVLATLTTGRGGELIPGDRDGEVTYLPSGLEPRLIAGSLRGLPYRAKSCHGSFPPAYVPQLATAEWFESRKVLRGLDFRRDLWPWLARELVIAELQALAEHHPDVVPGLSGASGSASAYRHDGDRGGAARWGLPPQLLQHIATADATELDSVVTELVSDPRRRQYAERLDRPVIPDGEGDRRDRWRNYVQQWIFDEQESINSPGISPRAAVNRAMAYLRGRVSELIAVGAIDRASILRDVDREFFRLNIALASGPPPERASLLIALIRGGLVTLLGEGSEFEIVDGASGVAFRGSSRASGQVFETRAFIETRMSKGDVDITDDPLLRSLLDSGRARLYTVPDGRGTRMPAHTLDVDPETFALIDSRGEVDAAVLVLGIPAQDVQPGSAIGATPGVPSPLIAGADRVAALVLSGIGAAATCDKAAAAGDMSVLSGSR